MCYQIDDVHTEQHGDLKLRIVYDTDPENPREWDNVATFGIGSNRYFSGDVDLDKDEFESRIKDKRFVCLPIYAYIHSGIRLRTGSFRGLLPEGHAEFDSGLAGLAWVSNVKILEELGLKRMSEKARQWARDRIEGEVQDLNNYFEGSVYGFIIEDKDEIHLDSCWGFLEDYQSDVTKMHVYQEAKAALASILQGRKVEQCA